MKKKLFLKNATKYFLVKRTKNKRKFLFLCRSGAFFSHSCFLGIQYNCINFVCLLRLFGREGKFLKTWKMCF